MPQDRYALLIAVNHYPFLVGGDLDGCVNDARLMGSILTESFGFPEANLRFVLDTEATRANVLAAT